MGDSGLPLALGIVQFVGFGLGLGAVGFWVWM